MRFLYVGFHLHETKLATHSITIKRGLHFNMSSTPATATSDLGSPLVLRPASEYGWQGGANKQTSMPRYLCSSWRACTLFVRSTHSN